MSDTAGESVAIERTENEIDKESGVNNVDDQDLGGNDSPELKSDITEKKGEDDDGKERHEDELGTEFDDSGCKQSRWRWFWASLVVAVLGGGLYSHPIMLHGELVYDDGSTIAKNPNVLGLVPWSQILKRDFWGGDQLIGHNSLPQDYISLYIEISIYLLISSYTSLCMYLSLSLQQQIPSPTSLSALLSPRL